MKVAALVSGGVDSSVALRLLKEQGADVTAFYLKFWLEDEVSYLGDCPWEEDLSYVRQVCLQINVPLSIVPIQKVYFERIIAYALAEIKKGRTPNPDMLCNNQIKFGYFLEEFASNFDKVGSGHYAQLEKVDEMLFLKESPDRIKDQTYFLARLNEKQLSKLVFPIGHLTKNEVRKYAHLYELSNKDRKDSQGLCFLGKFKFSEFLKYHFGEKRGDLIDYETGKKLAEHQGHWYYTIGQRKRINLSGGPWYVVSKDAGSNTVYVSRNYHTVDRLRKEFNVTEFNWFSGMKPQIDSLHVKIRHGIHKYACRIVWKSEDTASISLDTADQGIAGGQFAVFYQGDRCLGSGIIR